MEKVDVLMKMEITSTMALWFLKQVNVSCKLYIVSLCFNVRMEKLVKLTGKQEDLRHYTAVTKTNLNLVKPDLVV